LDFERNPVFSGGYVTFATQHVYYIHLKLFTRMYSKCPEIWEHAKKKKHSVTYHPTYVQPVTGAEWPGTL